MSHPTIRVLAMLELLQARRQLSGAELAAGLGVDQRTVRRYALRLADLGIPVTAERGRYGGYRLLPGYRLPPLMLTDDEAAAVVIGLLAAERLGQPVAGISTALAKIQRVLPAALSERVAALRQTLGFTQHQRKPAVAADTGTQHVTRSLAAVPYAHEIEVVLATTLANAQRRIPPTVATLAETEGGVLLTGRAEHLPGLAAMLAGLGWPFTVRRPAALRDRGPRAIGPPARLERDLDRSRSSAERTVVRAPRSRAVPDVQRADMVMKSRAQLDSKKVHGPCAVPESSLRPLAAAARPPAGGS